MFRFEFLSMSQVIVPLVGELDEWPNPEWQAEAERLTAALRAGDTRIECRRVDPRDEHYPAVEVRWKTE